VLIELLSLGVKADVLYGIDIL